ncbi:RING/FYVE/PHD zinc finger superfamily protein [Quillaja saponaria]|uniref:RING/FYVE/PHD zinc finger superfamily protein n=1 Tax=Quillaja saponaria TaxID=32244 RepID=A0AAD7L9C4_QUISA|nr:RING/FYVE/PHD zinc finger superfamily protein [Quillaja saponaria]KAJ7953813.1 RING/FYVE/PHD zinc finger superfamily protein [Quillaja saponaria]
MSDHLVLYVDHVVRPTTFQSVTETAEVPSMPGKMEMAGPSSSSLQTDDTRSEHDEGCNEDEPLLQIAECRICQEEDSFNNLETPCGCSGSLKFAHRKCVQHWCNEKGDITCEICHQPYQPGYTAPPPRPRSEETIIDIGGGWTISGTPLDLHDPRLLAIAEAERQFLEAEYDEYAASNASGAAFCRSAALILMALLLLRHALSGTDAAAANGDDDPSAFFSLFLLRAASFLLPCYIMAWAISILQRRRQRQEAAALAATQVAFVLQTGQHRGLQVAIASGPSVNPHPEQV